MFIRYLIVFGKKLEINWFNLGIDRLIDYDNFQPFYENPFKFPEEPRSFVTDALDTMLTYFQQAIMTQEAYAHRNFIKYS